MKSAIKNPEVYQMRKRHMKTFLENDRTGAMAYLVMRAALGLLRSYCGDSDLQVLWLVASYIARKRWMQFTIRSQAWWWVVTGRDVATMLNIRAEEAEREMTK